MKTPRCIVCKKKTLTGSNCSCGVYLCIGHRHPESHNCTHQEKNKIISKQQIEVKLMSAATVDEKVAKI